MRPHRAQLAASLATLAALAGVATCSLAAPQQAGSQRDLALGALAFELFLALLALSGAALSPEPLARRLGLGRGRLSASQLAALVVGTVALSAALDSLLDLTQLRERSVLPEFDAELAGARGTGLVLMLLAFGVAPGIGEELLCRGLVQRGLERRVGAALAIGVTAVGFGALHVDPIHAVSAGILGLYLGIACWLAASVRAAVACHVANNLIAVWSAAFELGAPPVLGVGLGAGAAGAALAWVWRSARRSPEPAPAAPPARPRGGP